MSGSSSAGGNLSRTKESYAITNVAKRPCSFVSRKGAKAQRSALPYLRAFAPLRAIPSSSFLFHHRRRLDLDLGGGLDQALDLDQRHRRVIRPHDLAQVGADFVTRVRIFVAVDDVAGHAHDMLRSCPVLGEDLERVAERPRELGVQLIFRDVLVLVPADDAGGEDHPPLDADPVGIALRPGPVGRLENLHAWTPFKRSRAMIWRCTSLAPS